MSEIPGGKNLLSLLWGRSVQGDQQAFAAIHTKLFSPLYYYALKILGDPGLANDVVQELFIKLWVRRQLIGGIKNVEAYFFISLRRRALNELRNLKNRSLRQSILEGFDIEISPEEIVIRNQEDDSLKQRLLQLLNELPNRQKEVIFLHYLEELDYDQIAAIMGINYQSVLNLVQKALQKLRSGNLLLVFFALRPLSSFLPR